jgi:protein SCO1/2
MILTPDGRVSRYLFGIRFLSRDLKLGIMEASEGRVGSLADQLLLFCFHYDPQVGAYTFAIINAVRVGAGLTVLALAVLLYRLLRHEKNQSKPPTTQPITSGL